MPVSRDVIISHFQLPRDCVIIYFRHVTHSPYAGNMAAVEEQPLQNGDVAEFTVERRENDNNESLHEEVYSDPIKAFCRVSLQTDAMQP